MGKVQVSPFDVTYTISFSGATESDGVSTVTSQMVRDKILATLEEMIYKKYISEYRISVEVNNIKESKAVIERSEKNKQDK